MEKTSRPLKLAHHLAVFLAYTAISIYYCRPIAAHFSTHYLGGQGDLSVDLWNVWHFKHALLVQHSNPFLTHFMYWPNTVNLLLHQYTLFENIVSLPLISWIGGPAAFNLQMVLSLVLAAYFFFLMARDWGASWEASFVAGALFSFSPAVSKLLSANIGFGLQTYFPFVLFIWALCRAIRGGRLRDAVLAAAALTLEWMYNYYFFMFCCLLIPFFYFWIERPLELAFAPRPQSPLMKAAKRACEAAIGLSLLAVAAALRKGQKDFHGQGSPAELLAYVLPYLIFWACLAARLALSWTVRVRWNAAALARKALFPYAATVASWGLLNLPLIVAVFRLLHGGGYAGPQNGWRGGGMPVDPAWLLVPDVANPIWGGALQRFFARFGAVAPEVPPFGVLPLAATAWLWRRRPQDRWVSVWFAGFVFSFIITLGPWLKIFGIRTYLPLPFFFLHLFPIFNNLQHGIRFVSFVAFFMAMLFAVCIDTIKERLSPRAARWVPVAALALMAFEYAPPPRPLFHLDVPAVISRLGPRPDGAMLTVPTGAVFNGVMAAGGMGIIWPDIALQAVHQKPIIGGYLGRIPQSTYRNVSSDPMFQAIVAAQSGGAIAASLDDPKWVENYLREKKLRYVLVDDAQIPAALRKTISHWPVKKIDEEGGLELYAFE